MGERYERGQEVPGTRCTVEYLLGEGGYGSVFRCRHVVLGRRVVLKLLQADHRDREDLVERMMGEAKALAQLDHPNIALIHDAGMTSEEIPRPFLTLQFYPGETLAQALSAMPRGSGIGLLPALEVGIELCDALRAAHERGIVHRDIKPGNIYLARTHDDRTVTKVIDFGIAHFKEAQSKGSTGKVFLGTPRYSAPEQIQGLRPSERTDLYAVGLVLYDCVCGRGPFDPEKRLRTTNEMIRAHLQQAPTPMSAYWSDLPRKLVELAASLLAKDPAARPPNASIVASALRTIKKELVAAHEPTHAGPDPNATDPTPFDNRQLRFSAQTGRGPDAVTPEVTPAMRRHLEEAQAEADRLSEAMRARSVPAPPVDETPISQPRRTTERMAPIRLDPAVTSPMPNRPPDLQRFARPTATSEPIDRQATTPSMVPPQPPGPQHGTEELDVQDDNVYLESGTEQRELSHAPAAGKPSGAEPGTLSRGSVISAQRPTQALRGGASWALSIGAGAVVAIAVASVGFWALTRVRPRGSPSSTSSASAAPADTPSRQASPALATPAASASASPDEALAPVPSATPAANAQRAQALASATTLPATSQVTTGTTRRPAASAQRTGAPRDLSDLKTTFH
jgi:serine/threonine-protein kinase